MESRSPGREGHGAGHADLLRELSFEGVDIGSKRGDPVRVEGCLNIGRLTRADVRGGEGDCPSQGTWPITRAGTPYATTPSGTSLVTTAPAPT